MQMQIEQLTLKLAGMEATQEQFMVLLEAMQGVVKEAQKGMFKKKKRPRHEDSDEAEEEEAPDKVQKRKRGRPKKKDTKQKGQEA
jgi:hypothetical protein